MQHTKASVCGLKSFCSAAAEDDAFARLMEIMESRGKKYPSGIKSQGDRRNILVTFFTHMTGYGELLHHRPAFSSSAFLRAYKAHSNGRFPVIPVSGRLPMA